MFVCMCLGVRVLLRVNLYVFIYTSTSISTGNNIKERTSIVSTLRSIFVAVSLLLLC